ncbi:proline/glycine betaine ABC transporter permease, partial [Patescibacteria group bacterium]|nr:proline/glycine betaine ABC transporter permease [Patescibacteria group bacterium]
ITRLNVGQGIAAGVGIVLLAMIFDRLTKAVLERRAS